MITTAETKGSNHRLTIAVLLGFAVLLTVIAVWRVPIPAGAPETTSNQTLLESAVVGVVETKSNMAESRMIFYDDELIEIGSVPFEEAQMEQVWGNIPQVGDAIYLAPFGDFKYGAGHEVLEISLKDLSVRRHDVDEMTLNGAAANDQFAFAYNDVNGASTISRCDKQTGETKKVAIPGDHITNITCIDDELWVFLDHADPASQEGGEDSGVLQCYDENLSLLDTYDISTCGSGHYRTLVKDGVIYFTSLGKAPGCTPRTLGAFDTTAKELLSIPLEHDYANGLAIDGTKLYISYCDVIADRSSAYAISVYNIADGSLQTHDITLAPMEIAISHGRLYVLDSYNRQLAAYDPSTFELLRMAEVSSMDNDYSYLGNMFSLPVDNK